jgi:hypothetical protein
MKKEFVLVSALVFSQISFAAPLEKKLPAPASSSLHVDEKTQLPNGLLFAGDYTISIIDHLSDRVIVEVSGADGSDQKFLGVPMRNIAASSKPGPVLIKGQHGSSALRGFVFPKENVIEFVYPKEAAIALAKSNGVMILAVDPASDGLTLKDAGLSDQDKKIVTLWMLTPTSVGPGIEAARYHSDAAQPIQLAEARKPAVTRLPKTASALPLFLLLALAFFGTAVGITYRRIRALTL